MKAVSVRYPIDLKENCKDRSSGVHLSGILRAMAVKIGMKGINADDDLDGLIDTTGPYEVGTTGQLMRIVIGYAWEDWLGPRIGGAVYHPGEYSLDGIFGSPDAIGFDQDGSPVLHEFKATFKSSKTPLTNNLLWVWQAAGYLSMISATHNTPCQKAVLHPLYIKGDYSGIDPQYLPVMLEFEREELTSLWNMVVLNKDLAKAEIHG